MKKIPYCTNEDNLCEDDRCRCASTIRERSTVNREEFFHKIKAVDRRREGLLQKIDADLPELPVMHLGWKDEQKKMKLSKQFIILLKEFLP